jgi:hypothetical protein
MRALYIVEKWLSTLLEALLEASEMLVEAVCFRGDKNVLYGIG